MKTTVAACAAAILTSASLMACVVGSTPASASPGGRSNVGHSTPSRPSGFGLGFAKALAASGHVPTDIATDRWGPNNTVAFGNPTNRWGPALANKRPGYVAIGEASNSLFRCPCVVAYDPFKARVFGGVPIGNTNFLAKELVYGVGEQTYADQHGNFGASGTSITETDIQIMGNVWGPHFDPAAPRFEGFIFGPDHGGYPLFLNEPNTIARAR